MPCLLCAYITRVIQCPHCLQCCKHHERFSLVRSTRILMEDDLTRRLLFAENDLLAALGGDMQMLTSYSQTWSTLPDALHTASQTGSVGHETFYLAHFVASRIANLAWCFLDIRREEESSTAALQSDCDAMLQQMAALDLNANTKSVEPSNAHCIRSPYSKIPISDAESSSPSFLASAHRWLVDNLHNPYPSAEVKARIAAAASCRTSSVNSWFINARRRIGWTTLCRERFSNCRADMIDAACRALMEDDPQRMLSPDLRHSFVAMKVAAENLYPSSFVRSSFAGDQDSIVKDVTTEHKEFNGARGHYQVEAGNFVTKRSRDPYPSPDRSVAASPVPALDDSLTDESEEEDASPPIIAGCKRRRSSIEPADQPPIVGRTIKRLRTSTTTQKHLPFPPASTDGVDLPSYDGSPEPVSVHYTPPESTGALKQPCASMFAPRSLSISGPLPSPNTGSECSIDDWFNTDFDTLFAIPPPVDATEPELSSSWEVELFRDYSIPDNPKHTLRCPPVVTAVPHASAGSDISELDSLLRSIAGDASQIVSSPGPYTLCLDPSSTPDTSSIDWTSLLNGSDAHQAHMSSQYATDAQCLSGINLPMLQLPNVIPPVSSRTDSALKQEKLYQLHIMQEAVRRMEQELESEGVTI